MDKQVELLSVSLLTQEYGRFVVGLVLIAAGISKLGTDSEFVTSVRTVIPMPIPLVRVVRVALPYIEVTIGALLSVGLETAIISFLARLLFAVFAIYALIAVARGARVACFCYGAGVQHALGWGTISRNVLLIGCAWAAAKTSPISVDGWLSGGTAGMSTSAWQPAVVGFGLSALTILSYTLINSTGTLLRSGKHDER
jgi:uncharacterized membrane protein YphA (DoxX/SURF4 family)